VDLSKIKLKIKQYIKSLNNFIYHFGLRYYCPFCKKMSRRLLPRGTENEITKNIVGMGRRNSYCPFCYSTDRERLLFLYLSRCTDIFTKIKNYKILHFAPEKKIFELLISNPSINYLTADLYAKNVMMKIDVTNIPFEDEYFDVIICNHVLEHVHDDFKAMKELYRVLKIGGWGILQVPISYSLETTIEDSRITLPEDRQKIFGQIDHVRIYGLDYIKRLRKVGFKVKIIDSGKEFSDFKIKFLGLIPDEKIFVVSK